MQEDAALIGTNGEVTQDLGPLAWVLDELRKSLDGATKALRRFVRDAELARGSDLAALDASQLRIARQQLHQAVGALEMVGMVESAKLLRAMEALARRFVQRPELCSMEAANKVELASFALIDYLQAVLKGRDVSQVSLFPQYRSVLQLVGDERVHPADLWPQELRWLDPVMPQAGAPQGYDSAIQVTLYGLVLKIVKSGDRQAASAMCEISLDFASAQKQLQARVFWKICAAYFEAVSLGMCAPDVYAKRAASQILLQFRGLARGEQTVSERLVLDLLFFCAQAVPQTGIDAPALSAVRAAYGLTQATAVNYETPRFGLFDPALLVQARKRIAAATETWSGLAGGDTNRLKVATEQFGLVTDSMLKLNPQSGDLVRALMRSVESTAFTGEAPTPAIAMEVATVVLYLEAAYEDLDPTDPKLAERSASLARRLEQVNAGGQPVPLEAWMEELYRRVSDRQIMGSVVGELRTTLGGIEKSLDLFFRDPLDKSPLHEVPGQLAQMRGVFSVLGLDQAALAIMRMRDSVEKFLVDTIDVQSARSGIFEKLGNSLGTLGFLIDMLSYQRALAKNLFVYDEELGEFKPLMGREKVPERAPALGSSTERRPPKVETDEFGAEPQEVAQVVPSTAADQKPAPVPQAPVASMDDDDAELRDIFLEEAREVVQAGLAAVEALAGDPADMTQQTTLRRAFHTLKGSSRMVGLNELGEAAWSMEQVLNSWLSDERPASPEMLALSGKAMNGFGRWVEDIAGGTDAKWKSMAFRTAADALRLHNQYVELVLVGEPELLPAPVASLPPAFESTQISEFESTQVFEPGAMVPAEAQGPEATGDAASALSDMGLTDFDFGFETPVAQVPSESEQVEIAPVELAELPVAETPAVELPVAELPVAELPVVELPVAELPAVEDEAQPGAISGNLFDLDQEEPVKVVGDLRIGIALYNVYLNEADELSRHLLTELNEWALELPHPVSDTAIALAHSLSGCSGTVGFRSLAEMARLLEQVLQHVQLHAQGRPEHASVFVAVAEDIRRLLHQFAAGFLKESDRSLLEDLRAILEDQFTSAEPDAVEGLPVAAAPELELPLEVEIESARPEAVQTGSPELPEPSIVPTISEPAIALVGEAGPEPEPLTQAAAAETVSPVQLEPVPTQVHDVLDVDLFPIFVEEAHELLPRLGGALRQWTADSNNLGARSEALRVLHTLKGSSRLAGAMHLGGMTHNLESLIEQLGLESLSAIKLEPLLPQFDEIQVEFNRLCELPEEALSLPESCPTSTVGVAAAPIPTAAPAEEIAPAPAQVAAATQAATPVPSGAATPVPAQAPAAEPVAAPAVTPTLAVAPPGAERRRVGAARQGASQTVRVQAPLLDRMVNQAGEVMITRSRLEARLGQLRVSLSDLTGNLARLRQQLHDIEMQSESQMQSRLAQAKDTAQGFDPLEFDRFTRVQELTRMMAESVSDIATVQRGLQRTIEGSEDDLIAQGRQARELQRDLLRTRMVEFGGISERLYGVVRQAGKDAGKQVRLDIKGASLDMDRGVLERMTPVFEHLLRNSVAHGIEDTAQRSAAGKSDVGNITIQLQQQSNDVTIEFDDDGAGLDLEGIRKKALAGGQMLAGDSLNESELAELIFIPGFSTAQVVTNLAGRGIGLDVVRSEVNALGGHIDITTQRGQGTQFKLVLPLTTAVTNVVLLRIGEMVIGVAANLVEMVRRVVRADVDRAYESKVFDYGGEQVPFYWAGALLQASAHSSETPTKTQPVVIFRSAGRRVAVQVDEVLGNQEVVVKNLGPQLSRLPGLTGLSVLASGAVVLLYNPVALASVYGQQTRRHVTAAGPGAQPQETLLANVALAPLVLVVDDSITVRRVTQRLLKREGFRVALANDGLQALERLQEEKPAVVLSDIEMPRMDGFDLARNIRGDAKLRDIPIIMITSRIAEKHREHARELGVDHYLGKPYSEEELIGLVRQYCAALIES